MRRRLSRKMTARLLKPSVEGVEKRVLLATFTVTNTTDTAAAGSLRWAIGQSNASPGSNKIDFDLSGLGVQTIDVTSPLPTISVPVTIDGTTQPGYVSTPLIELNGVGATVSGSNTVDGLDISAGASTIKGLAINRFSGEGISLSNAGGDLIEDDFIGTDPTGTIAEGNGLDGVLVQVNSNGNTIEDNLISGNADDGIYLNGQLFAATNPTTSGNLVIGNLVGTDVSGTSTLQNENDGIAIQNAPLTTIGGTTAAARNVFSGNGTGLELFDNSDGSVIEGNYIGTDITGEVALGNSGTHGFFNDNLVLRGISNSTIGGTVAGAGNVISGGSHYGIDSFVIGSENLAIQGNLIGTDATGTKALGNASGGMVIAGPSNVTIGGTVVGARNVISANPNVGIVANSPGLVIQGNYIGTDITGTQALGNGGDGIEADSTGTVIGGLGTGAANVIANNGFQFQANDSGVAVQSTDISVLSNSIYNNERLGIDVTNNSSIAPVLTSAIATAENSAITGSLTDSPGTYTLQFYSVPTLDASNHAEGETLLGTATVTITSTSASFTEDFPAGFTPGSLITATATNSAGATSEFSSPVTATGTGLFLANPTITVTSSPSVDPADEAATYTFTITNPNAVTDTGVVFYDPIPAGTTFDSGTTSTGATVAISEGQAVADLGAIGAGESVTVTILLIPTPSAIPSFVNLGSVAADVPSLLPNIDNATITTNVIPSSDLAVTVSGPSGSTAVGDQITYKVTVTNNGAADATGVTLSDDLPTGTSLVSDTVNSGPVPTLADGVLTDNYGDLADGSSFTLTIVVLAGTDAFPSAVDSASVSADQPDYDLSNNAADASAAITFVSDVGVTIIPSKTTVGVGETETYEVTVTNSGPSPASDVSLSDILPADVTFVSATASSGPVPTHSNGSVADVIGTIGAGGSFVIEIAVIPTSLPSTEASTTVIDSASVTTTATDPNMTNNSASSTVTVIPVADLAITSVTATPGAVDEGQDVTFTIDLTNNGPSTATSPTITDTLPAGLTFVSGSLDGGGVDVSGQVVMASLTDLASGDSATLTIVAATTAPGTLTNTATVASPVTDPVTTNNSGSASVTVTAVADLSVALSGDAGPLFAGSTVTYTAVITNDGPATASNVVLVMSLPAGADFGSIADGDDFGTLDNNEPTIETPDLAPGASATVVLTFVPTQVGTYTETANVTSLVTDTNPTNNSASFNTTVIAPYETIAFTASTYSIVETGGFASITLQRTGDTSNDVTVQFMTSGGNATAGLDYQPVVSTVDFPANVTTATVDVPVFEDPYDNHDELVSLVLSSPTGGALLQQPDGSTSTSPISAVLDIIDTDPVIVGPIITDLKLIGPANSITAIEVDTTGNLNPITASYSPNYSIVALGGGKGTLPAGTVVPIVEAAYNASTGSVTLIPAFAMPGNELFQVLINGEGPTALSDRAGNPLNSILNLTPGSDYVLTVARGTTLSYTDQNGTAVTLKLTGPGTLDIDRTLSGEVGRLQVVGATPKTVVTGTVHGSGKSTTIGTILGLGDFGSFHFDLTTPRFYVTRTVYPNSSELTDTAAVDTLLTPPPAPKPSKIATKTVKAKSTTKTTTTTMTTSANAESISIPTVHTLDFVPTDVSTTSSSKSKVTVKTSANHPRASTARNIHIRKTY